MKLIKKILVAVFTKFSLINMTQFAGMATLIVSAWQGADLISPSVVLLLTGAITLCLKLWQSTKEMVDSGFSLDWSVWLMGLVGMGFGFVDTFITDGQIMNAWFGESSKTVIMTYLALTVVLRTGFTNQSLNTKAAHR